MLSEYQLQIKTKLSQKLLMNEKTNNRSALLDFLKGIAIIAVILYHAGIFDYGYLGVEIFLVIGGYLITKSIIRNYENGGFLYFDYLHKRLIRLWPLALIISAISLIFGYFVMLPMIYKNVDETVIGTSTFTNNFVQFITSGNYWDPSNNLKPLMHTWYIGLMFQFYVIYPLIFILTKAFSKRQWKRNVNTTLYAVFFLSLLYYLVPQISDANKFFLLPARLFEFTIGGIIALNTYNIKEKGYKTKTIIGGLMLLLFLLLCIKSDLEIKQIRLLTTVLVVSIFLINEEKYGLITSQPKIFQSKFSLIIVKFGVASYSLYLWHQVILAFYRNTIHENFTVIDYVVTLSLSVIVGLISYYLIEESITRVAKNTKGKSSLILAFSCIISLIIISFGGKFYLRHGVVRDIPELDISYNNPTESQDYNSRITSLYAKPFPNNGRTNILVVGDSFGRDWINILLESGKTKGMNISYHTDKDSILRDRIKKADIIFLANNGSATVYDSFFPLMLRKKFWRVGNKTFNGCNNDEYNSDRNDSNYYEQTYRISSNWIKDNIDKEQQMFGNQYINIMASIMFKDGTYPVFTPDHKFFSHDGIHLTKAGARRFAQVLNISKYISLENKVKR